MYKVGGPGFLMTFFLSQTVLDLPTKQWLGSAVCGYSVGHHSWYLQPGFVFHSFDFHITCQDCRAISPVMTQLPLDRIQMLGSLGVLHPVPWTGASFKPLFQGHLVPWLAPNLVFIQWRYQANLPEWPCTLTSTPGIQYGTAEVWIFLSTHPLWHIEKLET